MTNIKPLSDLLNWKLLVGSHKFPSPEGGTCINEAAIVAAGFEYRAVSDAEDCPPCFSRPIAQYAIYLNDGMPHNLRQELLMPFVVRIAGTADTNAVEQKRAAFLAIKTVRRILPLALARWPKLAELCRNVRTLKEAQIAANSAADTADIANAANAYSVASAATRAAIRAANSASSDTADADAAAAAATAAVAAAVADVADAVWQETVAILNGAIALGKQAEPIETALVVERMAKARELTAIKSRKKSMSIR